MWEIKIHRLVLDEDFSRITAKDQNIILKTIYKKLRTAPQDYGAPLRHELKGFWKLKISDYRVVYTIEEDKVQVLVVKVGIRRDKEVYKQMIKRVKKI
jgi:mRNA interferase RelE/StbE